MIEVAHGKTDVLSRDIVEGGVAGKRLATGLAIVASFILPGCTSEAQQAEQRYQMVQRSGSAREICDAGRAVADAYLKAGNETEYRYWQAASGVDCNAVRLENLGLSANDDERAAAEAAAANAIARATEGLE